jgi:uncharacterized protein YbjQ (UPF0145 family)
MRLFRRFVLGTIVLSLSTISTAQAQGPTVQLSTTEQLPSCTVTRILGVVTAATRIHGDRASSQRELPASYDSTTSAMVEKARNLGANWILKVEFTVIYGYDRDGPATGHFPQFLAGVGTAVQASCPGAEH